MTKKIELTYGPGTPIPLSKSWSSMSASDRRQFLDRWPDIASVISWRLTNGVDLDELSGHPPEWHRTRRVPR